MKYGIYLISVLPDSGYGAGNDRRVLNKLKVLTYQEVSLLWVDQTDVFINYRFVTVAGLESDCILCLPDPRVRFWTAAVMPFTMKGVLIIFPNYAEHLQVFCDIFNFEIKNEYKSITEYYTMFAEFKQISIGFGFTSNDEVTREFMEKWIEKRVNILLVLKKRVSTIYLHS